MLRSAQRMASWTHLVRFVAREDKKVYLGQPVHPERDIGTDTYNGTESKVYQIEGSIFDGKVSEKILTIDHVRGVCVGPANNLAS
jgi:hypothetical protein